MRRATAAALAIGAGLVLPGIAPGPGEAAPIGISVSPPVLFLEGEATAELTVHNTSDEQSTIAVRTGNYVISEDGNVQIDPKLTPGRSAKRWLTVEPATLELGPRQSAVVTLRSRPARVAAVGDHHALVLLAATAATGSVRVRAQVGVNVLVRVGGPLVRKLVVRKPSVLRRGKVRLLKVPIANRGNVTERLARGQVRVQLRRGRRVAASFTARPTAVLAGTKVALRIPLRKLRGTFTVRIAIRPAKGLSAGPGAPTLRAVVRRSSIAV